jgi:ABC-type glycerol-3-phosphate transport system substrate-binding protein
MSKRRVRIALLCCAAASILLAGCGLGIEPTVTIVTNRPELSAYVDRYNAVQSEAKVELSYQETPWQAVLDGVTGDIVIGEYLACPGVMDKLEGLGEIVKPGKIDPSWFYARLITMGSKDNRPVVIPLSFSLPAVVFIPTRLSADPPAMFMPLDRLQALAKAYNKTSKTGSLLNVGFSPSWYPDFLPGVSLLYGARIRQGRNGMPSWDEVGLQKVVQLTRTWLSEVNGGASADAAFQKKAFVQPWYKLVSSGQTLFALASFTDFFALTEDERRDFDFRWLASEDVIPALPDVLFAGILRSAHAKSGAKAFLQWFCSPSVQQSLLAVNQSRRIGVFGVTNGFSALKSINEKDLPAKYPLLLGHVPQETMIAFPETLPDTWLEARDTINAWIRDTAAGTESRGLDKKLEEWQAAKKK